MLKNYQSAALALAAMLSVTMYSCKDHDDKEVSDITAPIPAVEPLAKEAMSAESQKENLEKVAVELSEKMPASDFENLFEYLINLSEHLGKYSDKELSQWAQKSLNSMTTVLSANEGTDEYSTETANYFIKYYTSTSKNVLALSAFTGHFSIKDNKWVYEEANDLQFNFVDQNGDNCTVKVETSGDFKTVHVTDDYHGGEEGYFDYSGEKVVIRKNETEDTTFQYISLPEKAQLTFVRNGLTIASLKCKYKLSDLEGEEFNLQKSNLSSSSTFELANGYKAEVIDLSYQAQKKAAGAFRLSKNNEALVTLTLNTGIKFPSVLLSQLGDGPEDDTRAVEEDEEEPTYWLEEAEVKNFVLKLDILGKVQIQGIVSDLIQLDYQVEDRLMNLFRNDEAEYKDVAKEINALLDLGIFYDGKNAKQADLQVEAFNFGDEASPSMTILPTIKFADGTSYTELSSFFTPENFSKAIEAFSKLMQGYIELVGGLEDEE